MSGHEREPAGAARAATQARVLDWIEGVLWLSLLVVGSAVALAVLRDVESRGRPRGPVAPAPTGLIEAEDLAMVAKSRDFSFWLQPSSDFPDGHWSKDGHMFASNTVEGDWVELQLPDREPGRYAIELFLTKAADYGVVAAIVNGARIAQFDLWTRIGVLPTGALPLGELELSGRGDVLRLEVVGKNPNALAPHYQFAIDGVRLGAAPSAGALDDEARAAGAAAGNSESASSEPERDRVGVDGE
jgi:hypothetical protein